VQFRPLFLGIIMGDVLGAVLWQIVGWFTKVGMMVTVN
jgi:predicted PurR-regulated permease PerM